MADEPNDAVRMALDIAVFAPLGLLLTLQEELPKLAAVGRQRASQQISVARLIGKFAVDRLLKTAGQRASRAPAVFTQTGAGGASPALAAVVNPLPATPVKPGIELLSSGLAVAGYDSLAASQIVAMLGSLTATELVEIRTYEATHRARRTVLGKLDQLLRG